MLTIGHECQRPQPGLYLKDQNTDKSANSLFYYPVYYNSIICLRLCDTAGTLDMICVMLMRNFALKTARTI